MRLPMFLAAVPLAIALASPSQATTFTYRLSGSSLTDCFIRQVAPNTEDVSRACTPSEREQYRPPDGPTLDGLLRIDEGRLVEEGFEGLVDRSYFDAPGEYGARDGFILPDLANVKQAPADANFFGLETDAARRPIVWNFGFNVVVDFFEPGPETFFSNAAFVGDQMEPVPGVGRAGYAVFLGEPPVGTIVEWRGDGGTLALVPLPAPLLLLLGGFGALALLPLAGQPLRRA